MAVSPQVDTETGWATGGELGEPVPVTSIELVAGWEVDAPSLAVKVKLSAPVFTRAPRMSRPDVHTTSASDPLEAIAGAASASTPAPTAISTPPAGTPFEETCRARTFQAVPPEPESSR